MQTLPLLLFVASLQLGVERPLVPVSLGTLINPSTPNVAVTVGSEHAVIWTDFGDRIRTYLAWLDAENRTLGAPTLLGTSDNPYSRDRVAAAASDGTNLALVYDSETYPTSWHVDLRRPDGSITPNTYTTNRPIVQIVSNGHGYLVRDSTTITPLDETGHVTGQPLTIPYVTTRIIVTGGRYLYLANDLFGVGAHYLDERSMTLGDRIHVPARGPDAVFADAAASRHGFAVLWSEFALLGSDLRLTEYDENGRVTAPATLVVSNETLYEPHLVANGGGYIIAVGAAYSGFDLFSFDAGRARRITPSTRSSTKTNVVVCDGDPALIVWADASIDQSDGQRSPSQVHAMTPVPLHWRVAAETTLSVRHEREQLSPRMLELKGRTYVAWMEHDEYDVLFVGAVNADHTALDGAPVQIATTQRRLQNASLATDGARLFLTWGEGPPVSSTPHDVLVGVALIAGDLRVEEQLSFTVKQSDSVPMAVVWDGIALNIITRPAAHQYEVRRFNAALTQLDINSFTVDGIDFDHASADWTGTEYVVAYTRLYIPNQHQSPTRALGYARMPRLDFHPRTTIRHDSVVRTNNVTPAIAMSPAGVLLAGNDQSLLYDGTHETWLDSTLPSRQAHVLWNPAGWFLFTNGGYVLRIDSAAKVYGITTLGDDVTESLAIEHGSQATLLYARSGRLYLRSMQ